MDIMSIDLRFEHLALSFAALTTECYKRMEALDFARHSVQKPAIVVLTA